MPRVSTARSRAARVAAAFAAALFAAEDARADSVGNDGDARIDHPEDPQCTSPTATREGPGTGRGLGAELALVLAWIARRRRAA